jgi:hypothetical protein
MEKYKKTVERADIIELDGYGKGLPVWQPYGLNMMNRIVSNFTEKMTNKFEFDSVSHPTLIPKKEYLDLFGNIGFENTYTLTFDTGETCVLKPDNLQFNFKHIFEKNKKAALSVNAGYRYETGIIPPLFRDRCIWPFVQFNHAVDAKDLDDTLAAHTGVLSSVFDDLCLPHFFVDSGKKRNYGLNQINGMSFLDTGELTVISMSYVLSDVFSNYYKTDKKLIDTGFTEKLLAMMALLHVDDKGLILPSKIAPYNLVCFDRNEKVSSEILDTVRDACYRVHADNSDLKIKRKFDIWEKKGANIMILTDGDSIEKVVKRYDSKPEPFVSRERLKEILAENDRFLKSRHDIFLKKLEAKNAEYYVTAVCETCLPEYDAFGDIYPHKKASCKCGKDGLERLITDVKRIY